MNGLVFYSAVNSKGRVDATGAFIPEAKKFAESHSIPSDRLIGIDGTSRNPAALRRAQVLNALRNYEDLDFIAFFCHGWPNGIQFGFQRKHIELLVRHFQALPTLRVCLYACLAAENDVRDNELKRLGPATDGGFADLMRDEMVRCGFTMGWVDGHKTAGHTSFNPYVVRFNCDDVDDPEFGAEGGGWVVEPRSTYWKKWISALRHNTHGMRYHFPVMDELHIKTVLDKI